MNLNLRNCWHPSNIAEFWPKGSVVLCRSKPETQGTYVYVLSLYFMPSPAFMHEDKEYLLIETPKETNE